MNSKAALSDLALIHEDAFGNPGTKGSRSSMKKAFENAGGAGNKQRDLDFSRNQSISPELNLLGMTTDEALSELDKYLDDARMSHLSSVRIVHGKGTGALRNAVHAYLRKQKYIESYPPAWILSEILPLGVISSLYSNIKDIRLKKSIAQRFGLQRHPFESWLTIVTLTRNACCHHARIWNKQNSIRPMMPNHTAYPWVGRPIVPVRIFFNLCIIKYFVNIISPENDMGQKLKTLLSGYPEVDTSAMGFPQGWEEEPVWNSTVVS
jgi:hypothetical protein